MADDVIANEDEKMVAEMHMLAKLALRTDQAVYNVNTGLCIVPDVNGDGELFGAQYTHTSLDVLLSAGSNGLPESALEYTMSYYPASGTCATNRLDAIYELEEGINAYDNDLEKTNSLPQMMDKNGSGWCFGDTKSIAETAHSFKLDKELEIDAVMRSDQENRCIAHDDSKDDPGNR